MRNRGTHSCVGTGTKPNGNCPNFLTLNFCLRQYILNHTERRGVAAAGFNHFAHHCPSKQQSNASLLGGKFKR